MLIVKKIREKKRSRIGKKKMLFLEKKLGYKKTETGTEKNKTEQISFNKTVKVRKEIKRRKKKGRKDKEEKKNKNDK